LHPLTLEKAMKGVKVVYHLAALVRYDVPLEDLERVHVTGTRNVLQAAVNSKVKRVVYASSVAAAGNRTTPYSYSKEKAEEVAVKFSKELEVIILRIAPIYGPSRSYVKDLVKLAKKGLLVRIGYDSVTHMVSLNSVIDSLFLAKTHGKSGVPYNIADKEPIPLKSLYNVVSEEMGQPVKTLPFVVAFPLLYVVGWLFEVQSKFSGKKPLFSRRLIKVITRDRNYDVSAAVKGLKFKPVDTAVEFRKNVKQMLKAV